MNSSRRAASGVGIQRKCSKLTEVVRHTITHMLTLSTYILKKIIQRFAPIPLRLSVAMDFSETSAHTLLWSTYIYILFFFPKTLYMCRCECIVFGSLAAQGLRVQVRDRVRPMQHGACLKASKRTPHGLIGKLWNGELTSTFLLTPWLMEREHGFCFFLIGLGQGNSFGRLIRE